MIAIVIPLALLLLPVTKYCCKWIIAFFVSIALPAGYKTLSIFNSILLSLSPDIAIAAS